MSKRERLLRTLIELLRIDSPTGREHHLAGHVVNTLRRTGVDDVRLDSVGNVLFSIDGQGEPILLNAHLDNVMPCMNVSPVVHGNVVRTDGSTVLGADDKAGIALIIECIHSLLESASPHRPVEAVLTVGEETGMIGAKALDLAHVGARVGVCLDAGGDADTVVISAPSTTAVDIVVHGKSAHAGANASLGINAISIAAEAIGQLSWGQVNDETTSNIGVIKGGVSRNVIPALVVLEAEVRGRDHHMMTDQLRRIRDAFETTALNASGAIEWKEDQLYQGYRLSQDSKAVSMIADAMRGIGLTPSFVARGGGTDANIFNERGIEVVCIGVGYRNQHSTEEHLDIDQMCTCHDVLIRLLRTVV